MESDGHGPSFTTHWSSHEVFRKRQKSRAIIVGCRARLGSCSAGSRSRGEHVFRSFLCLRGLRLGHVFAEVLFHASVETNHYFSNHAVSYSVLLPFNGPFKGEASLLERGLPPVRLVVSV